jgi:4-amino-4-deoxy-L-arabinose transferase-like glycosyltransferase
LNKWFNSYTWLAFSIIALTSIGYFSLFRPYWSDEAHFVETVRLFVDDFSFERLRDYPEVTPPLVYILYAVWAKIFGSATEILRLFSLLVALLCWQVLYRLNWLITGQSLYAWLLSLIIVVNPYFVGTSVFVYTDMFTILFCLLAITALIRERTAAFAICLGAAMMCRQYAIIFPVAYAFFWCLARLRGRHYPVRFLVGAVASVIPLLFLILYWGNIAPESGLRKWLVTDGIAYNFNAVTVYVTFAVVYLAPLVVWGLSRFTIRFIDLMVALGVSLWFFVFPVAPSLATLTQTQLNTVGLAHRVLKGLIGEGILLDSVLWFCFYVGCLLTFLSVKSLVADCKRRVLDEKTFFILVWLLFLIVMPFSYQVWEKYLLMVLPFLGLSIVICFIRKNIGVPSLIGDASISLRRTS